MEYLNAFKWMLVTKPSLWVGVQDYLLKNPEKEQQIFKYKVAGHSVFPVGGKIFLCTGREDKPVAIIEVTSYEPTYDKTDPATIVYFRVALQLRNSQKHNLKEVFRYLL